LTSLSTVEFENVHKSYGKKHAVDGMSMRVEQGEVLCLLGPNGAGKSTAINMMLGLIKPDSGKVRLFGEDPGMSAARAQIGVIPQDTDFPPALKSREIIELVRSHYAQPIAVDQLIEAFLLEGIIDRYTSGFSGGERRRLALALAFCGNGKAIFLDEPTTGLDQKSRQAFWEYARDYAGNGASFIITTHHLDEIENIATRICLLVDGKIRYSGSADEIRSKVNRRKIRFFSNQKPEIKGHLVEDAGDGRWQINSSDSDVVVRNIIQRKIEFSALEILPCTLEEAVDTLFEDQTSNTTGA